MALKEPKNIGIALVAVGTVAIIAALFGRWDMVNAIIVGLFARMPTGE